MRFYIILVHVCMYGYTWRAAIFFYIENENATNVVILEDGENMDPLFDAVSLA